MGWDGGESSECVRNGAATAVASLYPYGGGGGAESNRLSVSCFGWRATWPWRPTRRVVVLRILTVTPDIVTTASHSASFRPAIQEQPILNILIILWIWCFLY